VEKRFRFIYKKNFVISSHYLTHYSDKRFCSIARCCQRLSFFEKFYRRVSEGAFYVWVVGLGLGQRVLNAAHACWVNNQVLTKRFEN